MTAMILSSASTSSLASTPHSSGDFAFVRGHLLFGIHAHLPQPALYISLLRDPCARLESTYPHILEKRTTAYTRTST